MASQMITLLPTIIKSISQTSIASYTKNGTVRNHFNDSLGSKYVNKYSFQQIFFVKLTDHGIYFYVVSATF